VALPKGRTTKGPTTRVTPTTKRELYERALHCCEVCGAHGATNAHHRVNASQGGRPTLGNLLLVCGSGTTGCHGRITVHPRWAKTLGYSVPATFEPCDVPVARWSRWVGALEVVLIDDRGGLELTDRAPGVPT
jgi:5-methylcytosine-specific restriction endonuclease McrA